MQLFELILEKKSLIYVRKEVLLSDESNHLTIKSSTENKQTFHFSCSTLFILSTNNLSKFCRKMGL